MKKLNNKGFAISTLLYGLMLVAFMVVGLLISIMSTNRKNTSTLVRKIEEELNRYSETATEITSTDGSQEFIVPYGQAGWYKIELWGMPASNVDATNEENKKKAGYASGVIYLEENTHLYFYIGSYSHNGGRVCGGKSVGGATDVRLQPGNWNDSSSLASRIMTAGGGGHSNACKGYGHTEGYYNNDNGRTYVSGYGVASSHKDAGFINTTLEPSVYSGQAKARIELVSTNSKYNPPAKKTTKLDNVRYIKDCITGNKENTGGKERWTEIQVFNSEGQNIAKGKEAKYNGTKIPGITDGTKEEISGNITNGSGEKCIILDLGAAYNIEEIVIFHELAIEEAFDHRYKKEEISVSSNGSTYEILKQWKNESMAPKETVHGIRYSSRDLEGFEPVPAGNYFIHNEQSHTRVITANSSAAILDFNIGNKNQRWAITPIGDNYYTIVESSESKALQPADGGLEIGELVGTNTGYGNHVWEEWKIIPLKNGYYQLQSRANATLCVGGQYKEDSNRDYNGPLKMFKCDQTKKNQWFRLENADY